MVDRAKVREQMRALVEGWRRSGQSQAAYARRHGMQPQKLSYWKRVLGVKRPEPRAGGGAAEAPFVPVRLVDVDRTTAAGALEIVFGGSAAYWCATASRTSCCGRSSRCCGRDAERPAVGPDLSGRGSDGPPPQRRRLVRSGPEATGAGAHVGAPVPQSPRGLKILVWDRSGYWVMYERLERGTFAWPEGESEVPLEMKSTELMLLLSGVEMSHTRRRRWYEKVA